MKLVKYTFLVLLMVTVNYFSANAQIGKLITKAEKTLKDNPLKLSNDDIAQGLKQALDNGINEAVSKLSAEDGYLMSAYKIGVPEEATKVISKLKMVPGFENIEQELISKMNKAAENAAKKATPIFVNAVKSISFDDAMTILTGSDDAATVYLRAKSNKQLYDAFMPVIVSALDEVNAREYWRTAVKAYNSLPFVTKVNPELDDHVNNMALAGLFGLIAVKEEGIRKNVNQRNTELLRKVFAKQD